MPSLARIHQCLPAYLCTLVWSVARLGAQTPAARGLVAAAEERAGRMLDALAPTDIAKLAWGVAVLGSAAQPSLFDELERCATTVQIVRA